MLRTLAPVLAGHVPFGGHEPLIASIHAYWQAKRGNRRMPARRDIDMVEIDRNVLPYLALHDVEHPACPTLPPVRFRYRLVGTELVNIIGADVTHRYLDEVATPGRLRHIEEWLAACVTTGEPMTLDMPLGFPDRDYRGARRIVLPLSEDGMRPDILLSCMAVR